MEHEKYFAYDKLEIPEEIMNMTDEELDAKIARLEAKAIVGKNPRLQTNKKAS